MIFGYDSEQIRYFLFILCAAVQTLFVGLYITFPWYKTFLGRALFGKAVALAALMDVFLAARWFGWGNDWLFTSLYVTLLFGITAQTLAFLRVKIDGRADEVSGNSPTHGARRW